jgi:LPS-assembly protein
MSSRDPKGRRRYPLWLLAALCVIALAAVVPAQAIEPVAMDQPIEFKADEVTYDSRNKITRATGNVEAVQAGRRVVADTVVYDELRNVVTAEGNATLYEPSGEVLSGKSIELTGDLKSGVVEDLRAILADGSRLTAARGERRDGTITTAENATYTPCLPCAEDPSRAPLWQIRAVKVVHDQSGKTVEFSHAWLDISGIPVAYVPYFYQPDPSVKRKSGVLIPGFGQSSDLGFVAQVPYFIVLSESQDLTVTPWITTNEGPVLEAQYRQAFQHGMLDYSGSATYDSHRRFRGHVFGESRYDFNEDWRGGLDVQRTTDRSYLRRYGFDSSRTLTSRAYAENFMSSRDYLVGNALAFQNMDQNTDEKSIPYVAPYIDYYHVSERDRLGGQTDVRLGTATLTREDGADTRRLSARAQWQRPFVGPIGELLTVSTALWGDGYNVSNQTTEDRQNEYSGFSGRLFPQAGAQWRLPLLRQGETVQQIIEPIGEVILAPNFGNPSRIPNEDSQDFELQDSNLFGFNRLPGIDLVDEGPRASYGLNWTLYGAGGMSASAFVGQSYQFVDDNTFGPGTGLQDKASDIVSAIDLTPAPWLDLLYRNRIDHGSFDLHRNELTARVGVGAVRLASTYVRYDGQPQNDLHSSEQVQYALDTKLTRLWRSRVFGITDVKSESQREIGLRLIYEDECLFFSTELARENFKDRDVEPSNVVFFRVGFKTLGELGGGFKPPGGGG